MKKIPISYLATLMLFIPAIVSGQLKLQFETGLLDVGIHGLHNTNCMLYSPQKDKIIVTSSINSCISILKYDNQLSEWYHFESVFLEDYSMQAYTDFHTAIDPSGNYIYVVSQSDDQVISTLKFNQSTDSLELSSITAEIPVNEYGGIRRIAISSDGEYLYGSSWSHVLQFTRNPLNGEIVLNNTLELVDYASYDIRISYDSRNVYIFPDNSSIYNYILNYRIDDNSGSFIYLEKIEYTTQNNYQGLYDTKSIDLDPDDKYIYAVSNELSVFERDQVSGTLTFVANQENLGKPDIVNNKIRAIDLVHIDRINNQFVHLYSKRDGWIIMEKTPEQDTLTFYKIVENVGGENWFDERNLIAMDTSVFWTYSENNTFNSYSFHYLQDTVFLNQSIDANENTLDRVLDFLLNPEEDKLYLLADNAFSMFKRNIHNGELTLVGSIDYPAVWEERGFCMNSTGEYIYITSNYLSVFKTNEGDILPEMIQNLDYSMKYEIVRITNDDKYLYASTGGFSNSIVIFDIDNSGILSPVDTFNIENTIRDMQFSRDGKFLYTLQSGHKLIVYERNSETGLLSQIQEILASEFGNGLIAYANRITISNDQYYVYTGSSERFPCLLERDTVTGLLTVIGKAGDMLSNNTYRPHTIISSRDNEYMYLTHTWWDDHLFVFDRDPETGIITEVKAYTENDPELVINGCRQLLIDKHNRYMYSTGYQFIACFQIDPIQEDTLFVQEGEGTLVYANPYYEEYSWSVSPLNQNSISTDALGWIYLSVKDEFDQVTFDSVYVTEYSGIPGLKWKNIHFRLFPNPAGEHIVIEASGILADVTIRLYSLQGKLFKQETHNFNSRPYALNTKDLLPGIYLISFLESKTLKTLSTKRIIKE